MKTIFLSFSVGNSSVSDFFIALANKLTAEFRVIIVTDTSPDHSDISSQIDILKWPSKRPTRLQDFIFISRLIKKHKPEMMMSSFGAVNLFLVAGYIFGIKHRIAWYRTISTQFPSKKKLQLRKKYVYKMATRIFANSKATKQDLISTFDVKDSKVEVVNNAVKDPGIVKKRIDNKIVYVGRIHPSKGVETLIDALPLILKKYPDTKLTLVGGTLGGAELRKVEKRAEELQVTESIEFLGSQPKDRVLEEFSEAYLTVVPSLVEAFGFVVIESLSVKTPVIGSRTSGIAEIIRDEKDGFLFEPGNWSDLAYKIIMLLKAKDLQKSMSENCYRRFLRNYELERSTERLVTKIVDVI